MIYWWSSFS